ncbi:hypothetical protein HDU93_005614 [Gonapodya sp. JEL0774]|nr:hypothetical protein HDU93_005614 [Gonapodya sp. JEL0774]
MGNLLPDITKAIKDFFTIDVRHQHSDMRVEASGGVNVDVHVDGGLRNEVIADVGAGVQALPRAVRNTNNAIASDWLVVFERTIREIRKIFREIMVFICLITVLCLRANVVHNASNPWVLLRTLSEDKIVITCLVATALCFILMSSPISRDRLGQVPLHGIVMYSGNPLDLPENWKLCDGRHPGVPDLTDKFICGFSDNRLANTSGGAELQFSGTTNDAGEHRHDPMDGVSAYTRRFPQGTDTLEGANQLGYTQTFLDTGGVEVRGRQTGRSGSHHHLIQIDQTGTDKLHIMPSWYALAFIMRVK